MARKKIPDPEIIPDGVEIDAKPIKSPTRKVVETKTVTYDAPVDEAETPEEEDDFDFEEKPKRNKPTLKQEKQKLRDRWAKRGIAPTGNLRISLWKFTNDDDPMSGAQADKAYCNKFVTTEDAIDSGIHLEAASKYGPGRYWIMIYLNNQIVDQWEFRIAAGQPMGQVQSGQQMVSMPDPSNPQVTIQMPAGQPVVQKTFKQELKEMAETFELMQKLNGNQQPQPIAPPVSPEISVAELLMKDPHHAKKIVGNLMGGEGEKDLMALAFEHGPALIESLGNVIRNIISDVKGGMNGTAQVQQTTLPQDRNAQIPASEWNGDQSSVHSIEGIPQHQGNGNALNPQQVQQGHEAQAPAIRPEDELLAGILDHCKRRMPPRMAADRAFKYAEYVERVAPQQSVFTLIEQFTDNPIDESLALFELLSDEAKEILAMPHAKAWATQLQAELKKAYEPGGESGQS